MYRIAITNTTDHSVQWFGVAGFGVPMEWTNKEKAMELLSVISGGLEETEWAIVVEY